MQKQRARTSINNNNEEISFVLTKKKKNKSSTDARESQDNFTTLLSNFGTPN